jgi:hypothetical protein
MHGPPVFINLATFKLYALAANPTVGGRSKLVFMARSLSHKHLPY